MAFLEIARTEDIPEGGMKAYEAEGKEILIAEHEGKYYAMDRKCSHMKGDLLKGRIEDNTIICPRHGSRFDMATGKVMGGPKLGFIKLKTSDINTYKIEVQDGIIKVQI